MRAGDPLQLPEADVVEGWSERATWSKIQGRIRRDRRRRRLVQVVLVASAFLAGLLLSPNAVAAPRPAQDIPSGSMPGGGDTEAAPERTAAPLSLSTPSGARASGAASPTGGIGEPATGENPDFTPPATRTVSHGTPAGGIGGQATWWASFGSGLYAAIRPDLGTKGDTAVVCGGSPFHCLTLPIITTCACLGPGSGRLIDLSIDAFRSFADPSAGVVHVVVQVRSGRKASRGSWTACPECHR